MMSDNVIQVTNDLFKLRVMKVLDDDFMFKVYDVVNPESNAGVVASLGLLKLVMDKYGNVELVIGDKLTLHYLTKMVVPKAYYDDFIRLIKSIDNGSNKYYTIVMPNFDLPAIKIVEWEFGSYEVWTEDEYNIFSTLEEAKVYAELISNLIKNRLADQCMFINKLGGMK